MGTTATLSVTLFTFWPLSSRTTKYEFLPVVGSALFTRCGSAFSRRGCSCYQLWVRSFHPLWVRSFGFLSLGSSNAESADFAQELVGAAAVLFDVLVCLSACHALHDILMCFALCSARFRRAAHGLLVRPVPRLRSAADPRASCRSVLVISLSTDATMLRVSCFGLRAYVPPKLLEQRSAILLFCRHRCVGHVSHGQWTLLDANMLVSLTGLHVWWSLALVMGTPSARASRSMRTPREEQRHRNNQPCTCHLLSGHSFTWLQVAQMWAAKTCLLDHTRM